MSSSPSESRPARRWRKWLQFRLRSLLLLTLVVGVGTSIYLHFFGPQSLRREIPGGIWLQDGLAGGSPWFVAWDRYGRRLCRGRCVQGRADGPWTYYHENGRPALSGSCAEDCRVERWTAWNEWGRKTAEISHGQTAPKFEEPFTLEAAQTIEYNLGIREERQPRIDRSGAAHQWWDNGRPRSAGEFLNDQPHGPWAFWNAAAEQTAAGPYEHGRRLGTWTMDAAAPAGTARRIDYLLGRQVPSLERWLADCDRALASDDWRARQDAVEALAQAGSLAVPHWTQALRAAHVDVQQFALAALAQVGPPAATALPEIERLTRAADPILANEAYLAAFAVDEPHRAARFLQLLQFLREHLDARSVHLVRRMAQLHAAAVPLLEASLETEDAETCLLAVVILGQMFDAVRPAVSPVQRSKTRLREILGKARQHPDPRVAAHIDAILPRQERAAPPNTGMGGMF